MSFICQPTSIVINKIDANKIHINVRIKTTNRFTQRSLKRSIDTSIFLLKFNYDNSTLLYRMYFGDVKTDHVLSVN